MQVDVEQKVSGDTRKNISLEPDLNQRPMDTLSHYSPLLYQLSYQGMMRGCILITLHKNYRG